MTFCPTLATSLELLIFLIFFGAKTFFFWFFAFANDYAIRHKCGVTSRFYISPTAIKMFQRCARSLAFRQIDRVARDETFAPWAAEGVHMHSVLEDHRNGKPADRTDPLARIALSAVGYWPDCEWQPEVEIKIEVCDAYAIVGKSDQLGPSFVGDYKFTGSRENVPGWEKGIDDATLATRAAVILSHDPQWVVYAYAAGGDYVSAQWTYIVKPPKIKGVYKGEPKVIPVRWGATRRSIELEFEKMISLANAITRMRRQYRSANDVPHTANIGCQGVTLGCDYAAQCQVTNPGKVYY